MVRTLYQFPMAHHAEKNAMNIDALRKLKRKHIDAFFFEGLTGDLDTGEYVFSERYLKKINDFVYERGIKVKKTEDVSSLGSHFLMLNTCALLENFSRRITRNPLVLGVMNKLDKIFSDKRDYSMVRHIDEGLGEGQTGAIIHGIMHSPERYLADDIIVRTYEPKNCLKVKKKYGLM
jgi:hypothetical protein